LFKFICRNILELVQDLVAEADENSVHALNVASPVFTFSMPFANWLLEEDIIKEKNKTLFYFLIFL